ncbi:hypothetical protein MHBO_001861, partial [Bonamia ostreae]
EEDNISKIFLVLSIVFIFSGVMYAFIILNEDYICKYCDPKSYFGGFAIVANTGLIALSGFLARIGNNVGTASEDIF